MRVVICAVLISIGLSSCKTTTDSSAIKGNEFDASDARFAYKKNFEGEVSFVADKPFLFVDKPNDDSALKKDVEQMIVQAVDSFQFPAEFVNRVRSVGDNNPYEIQVAKVSIGATVNSRQTGPWVYSCSGTTCRQSDCINRTEEAVRLIEIPALVRLEVKDKSDGTTLAIVDGTAKSFVQPTSTLKFTRTIRSVFTQDPNSPSAYGHCAKTESLSPEERTLKEFAANPVNTQTVSKAVHESINEALKNIVVKSPVTTPAPGAEAFFCECPAGHGRLEYKAIKTSDGTERIIRTLETGLSADACLEAMKRFTICK